MSVYADLVERLRGVSGWVPARGVSWELHLRRLHDEVADAIEALEARNAGLLDQWVMAEQEITRLTLQQERP